MSGESKEIQPEILYPERRIFSYEEFNPFKLAELKQAKGLSVSVAIPTLNEAKTIGSILDVLQESLMSDDCELVDELIVVDSGSTDRTEEEVERRGVRFERSDRVLPDLGFARGKGENLWKSLFLTKGDLVVWTDADALNPNPAHVYGLLGPLIIDDSIMFTKAYFLRYTNLFAEHPTQPNGGRVTEILARPVLNLLFPEVAHIYQPYNGNVAGRREVLESLEFPIAYGADLTLLIDIAMQYGSKTIAQVYCARFDQEGQDLQGLGRMGFQALRAVLHKAQEYGRLSLHTELPTVLRQLKVEAEGGFNLVERDLAEVVRPPVTEVKERLPDF